MSFVDANRKLRKVVEQIILYDLLCIYALSALLIFVAKCNLIFVLNLWLFHVMPRFNFPEFIMNLSLLEIFNLVLCLDLHLNA
jgi:hypothetical protein